MGSWGSEDAFPESCADCRGLRPVSVVPFEAAGLGVSGDQAEPTVLDLYTGLRSLGRTPGACSLPGPGKREDGIALSTGKRMMHELVQWMRTDLV